MSSGARDPREEVLELAGLLDFHDLSDPFPPLPETPLGLTLARWEGFLSAVTFLTKVASLGLDPGNLRERARALLDAWPAPEVQKLQFRILVTEHRLRHAERLLEEGGLEFDWEEGQVRIPAGPNGGRPRHLFRELVRLALETEGPLARGILADEGRAKDWDRDRIRRRASELLSPYFPAEWCEPTPTSRLGRAVDDVIAGRL